MSPISQPALQSFEVHLTAPDIGLVFIDTAARRPTAIPADYRAPLEAFEGSPVDQP